MKSGLNVEVTLIEDSLSPSGVRLITLELEYPRFIHSEFMTHRVFSRNASSSRAIPINRAIQEVETYPIVPRVWGMNQPGMQSEDVLDKHQSQKARVLWLEAANAAALYAKKLQLLGVHKQWVNRILEPFMRIKVLVTATDWDNFFNLRLHPDSQPEIYNLAETMFQVISAGVPIVRTQYPKLVSSWHLPYISQEERSSIHLDKLQRMSTARCARVSYNTHKDSIPTWEEDSRLYDRLVGSDPIHASPAEHLACPLNSLTRYDKNFKGWKQYRSFLENSRSSL